MELNEKIQMIRKEHGLTQEEFADKIFVSRTAVSKWETGRGTPSLDSLQMISKEFNIRLDDLLSTEQVIDYARKEREVEIGRIRSFLDAFLNIVVLLAIFLPLYKSEINGVFYSVYLTRLDGWQGAVFCVAPITISLCGFVELLFLYLNKRKFVDVLRTVSLFLIISAIVLLILAQQPYPAVFLFVNFVFKALAMIKTGK